MNMCILDNSKKQNKIVLLMIMLFTVVIGIRDLGGIEINKYIFVALAIVFFPMLNVEWLVSSLCFFFPLFNGLPGNYMIFIWITVYILKTRKINRKVLLIFGIYMLAEMISCIWLGENTVIDILSYLACLYLLLMLTQSEIHFSRKNALESYFFGTFVFSIITLFSTLIYAPANWLSLFSKGLYRFGDLTGVESMHIGSNANELAYYALVGVSVGLVLLTIESNVIKKYSIFAGILSIALIGALSASRSYILILAVIVALYFGICKKSLKKLLLACVVLILTMVILQYINTSFPELLAGFTTRFKDSSTMSTAGGRTDLLHDYWETFFSKIRFIFCGTGVVGYKEATKVYNSTHNMFQQIIICYGIPLGTCFLGILLQPFIAYFPKISNKVLVLPFLSVIFFTQTIQFLNPWFLMLHFIIGVFAMQMEKIPEQEGVIISG